jgi:hypothetical protein
MTRLLALVSVLMLSGFSYADHHALSMEARQPTSELEMTSITIGDDFTVINAETQMNVYGRVYITFTLAYNAEGNGGTYTFQARAYLDEETASSATGVGVWNRDGTKISMHQLVNVSNGNMNYGKATIDPLNRTGTLDVYALK